jgi:hypothetical protein
LHFDHTQVSSKKSIYIVHQLKAYELSSKWCPYPVPEEEKFDLIKGKFLRTLKEKPWSN